MLVEARPLRCRAVGRQGAQLGRSTGSPVPADPLRAAHRSPASHCRRRKHCPPAGKTWTNGHRHPATERENHADPCHLSRSGACTLLEEPGHSSRTPFPGQNRSGWPVSRSAASQEDRRVGTPGRYLGLHCCRPRCPAHSSPAKVPGRKLTSVWLAGVPQAWWPLAGWCSAAASRYPLELAQWRRQQRQQ